MPRKRSKLSFLLLRVSLYLTVVVALLLWRDRLPLKSLLAHLRASGQGETTLTLAGRDLAPALLDRLTEHYQRDYPRLEIHLLGGGSNQALEALLNRDCSVAFLYRRPTATEQELFLDTGGDSVLSRPAALGALLLLSARSSAIDSFSLDELRGFFLAPGEGRCDHLYVPDPNFGIYDALRERLAIVPPEQDAPGNVIFLPDTVAVLRAVAADVRSVGLASTFSLSPGQIPSTVRVLPLKMNASRPAVAPGHAKVASAEYPLYHYLHIAIRKQDDIQAAMFVTHITSGKGQRQIERAGYLPAKQTPREILLTTHPLGEGR